jgi:D-beta-D-heptose 7-phosphate kinase/D-beta-D-heptose 1-phosphate adenosyltransferase
MIDFSVNRLRGDSDFYKKRGRKVLSTNGCFDLFHRGHLELFRTIKDRYDGILFVGINSDKSVERIKGYKPVINEYDRAMIISSLYLTECVYVFDEDNPCEALKIIKPDIHFVETEDVKSVVEYSTVLSNGGKVEYIPRYQETSTRMIKDKIVFQNKGIVTSSDIEEEKKKLQKSHQEIFDKYYKPPIKEG